MTRKYTIRAGCGCVRHGMRTELVKSLKVDMQMRACTCQVLWGGRCIACICCLYIYK